MNFYATQISNLEKDNKEKVEKKRNEHFSPYLNGINSAIDELKRRSELDAKSNK
jgi:hypothetical protein